MDKNGVEGKRRPLQLHVSQSQHSTKRTWSMQDSWNTQGMAKKMSTHKWNNSVNNDETSVSIFFSYNFASFIFKRAKCSFSIISNMLLLTFWVFICTLHLWKWKWANRVQVWFQNLLSLSCHSHICFLITPCLISTWRHFLFNQRKLGLLVRKVGFCFSFVCNLYFNSDNSFP